MMASVLLIFGCLALGLWKLSGEIFFLYNFSIIGLSLALGMGLWPLLSKRNRPWARRVSQLLVGAYAFFGLGMGLIYLGFGFIAPENMQIEGFWFLLFTGICLGCVLHYLIAKVIGPVLFGRGFCGWACWTAAVLDLLPWKRSPKRTKRRWEWLCYLHFAISLVVVATLMFGFGQTFRGHMGVVRYGATIPFSFKEYPSMFQIPELWWFLIGNLIYFSSAIILAAILRDNRAFCKYLCPIAVFLKASSSISVMRIKAVPDKCNDCGLCSENCPMDIDLRKYIAGGKRILSNECIACLTCTSVCPKGALKISMGFDFATSGHLQRQGSGN